MRRATLKPEVIEILKRKKCVKPPKEKKKTFLNQIPEIKPLPFKSGAFLFVGLILVGLSIGSTIGTYVFFGTITLVGLIALVESNKYIRYIVEKSNRLLDILIFGVTLFATISLGITITAVLTFAGLGYSLVYAPYLRSQNKN
ncbi:MULTISPECIES: hypothetical protein [Flavobacteriaceae]|uniref:Uncharacterized protein n=2 Tax=Flavobacteriaceae TaxID=49546 RepID=A0A4Y8ATE5_9FLAO|nr:MULTISPECIES: hypothetical protein [Flavobacteriaceae]TEW75118.1 hypothetical protein E2488_06240 [Gramella jeungdoensis]GGK41451.1 hypothetical protein GCM10007963_06820 [Lutibacter litoralis]